MLAFQIMEQKLMDACLVFVCDIEYNIIDLKLLELTSSINNNS